MKGLNRGFTLLEMLVSIAIFSLMMIAIYYFFDSGRWMYLHAEKRSNMQENGRLAMEAMEREMRMIGVGVPKGTRFGSEESWLPAVFLAEVNAINFRGDIDNINSWLKGPVTDTGSAQTISVENPSDTCPIALANPLPIIIVEDGKGWNPFTCTNPDDGADTLSVTLAAGSTGHAYTAEEGEMSAPQHVFYRFTPDVDDNCICDETEDFTQCKIERATRLANTPQTSPLAWETFATNVEILQFEYFVKDNDNSPNELTTTPLTGVDLSIVDMIRVTLQVKDRANKAGEYQDALFTSDILVRKRRY
jgi:prepilin-type N-terminal cleavage/methylation domain-containing protein